MDSLPGISELSEVDGMQIIEELRRFAPQQDTLLTIGVFDGVHLGHQHLIEHLKHRAESHGLLPGVVTFREHPQLVLGTGKNLIYLTTLEERLNLLQNLGISLVVPLSFTTEVANLNARQFVTLLVEHLRMRGLVVGPDFALGRGREGDIATLQDIGRELGFSVEISPPMTLENMVISSTAIRKALANGDVALARKLLGRRFVVYGPVVHGDARGRQLGFVTANIACNARRAIPADGVYASRTFVENKNYKAVTSIGRRPTFGVGERTIEVHLLDFQGDLYGKELKIELVERLRPEMKFASAEELKAQIKRDVAQSRALLE